MNPSQQTSASDKELKASPAQPAAKKKKKNLANHKQKKRLKKIEGSSRYFS